MTGQSGADVLAAVLLAVGLFAGSLVPFFLLINADLNPRRAYQALARTVRRRPAPRLPHWARNGHLPTSSSPSPAAVGRHRRGGAR
ncbi:hypothetical protein NC239_33840 [Streptomyces sp. G3]|uniref:hypothetical protein n=1 Tax=Streptomyces sp. G3 TaxID=690144 RepID=UPI00202DE95B|nr:hypothetical protein [Streptomyces sp. G3]MCM1943195.1 hypothetical protein [Streptomyces sp. G3]